jgi:polar amino acid transport system permease protein
VPGVAEGVFANRAVWVAIVGFTLNSAAYQAEYIRSALQSVEGGQLTAGRAIGLPKLAAIRHIVLPQGLRYAIPGWTNELIYLIKYSSLAAFITVPELFNRANAIASGNFRYLGVFTVTALFYLALVITASRLMNRVEDRVAIPGIGHSEGR